MSKTIAITPSWYWPENVDRVAGIPPYGVDELCLTRHARDRPDAPAIICNGGKTSFSELEGWVNGVATHLMERTEGAGRAVFRGASDTESLVVLLASLRAGIHLRMALPDESLSELSSVFGTQVCIGAEDAQADRVAAPAGQRRTADLEAPVIAMCGAHGTVNHSHRSLLAGMISLSAFLGATPEGAWLPALPLGRWEGVISTLMGLYTGVGVVLGSNGSAEGFAELISRERPQYVYGDLQEVTRATREARRAVKAARDTLTAMLVATSGPFDPGDRQRVGKSFRCPALTTYTLAETGLIFAAHPRWYLDESVGIPVTNAHVVPADPRNGSPISTLWEMVESAEVTVKGPMLMCGFEGQEATDRYCDGRYRTGVIASSDANGMIYVLPD